MKFIKLVLLILLGTGCAPAIEEIAESCDSDCKPISQRKFDKWDFTQAVRALGKPPGPTFQSTYDMLRSTWELKTYQERAGRQHYLINELLRNGNTTDMNTWLLIRADAVLLNHCCQYDRKLFFAHLIKPYGQEKPQELPHQLKWLDAMAFQQAFKIPYLLGILSAQRGIHPSLIDRANNTQGEVNRLWSNPVTHAPYLMEHGSDFARQMLRFLLHDNSVIYESARRSGLTCWNYTWGKDLPQPIALGLQLMQRRSTGQLPTAEELSAIRRAAEGLSPEMQGFIVRNMLVTDPTCMPWKKLDDPTATPAEMPDTSAVRTPLWDNGLLGNTRGIESDLEALEALVIQEQDADMLSSLVLFTLADGDRIRKDRDSKEVIPTQGHYRYTSTFDVEVSENGVDVLIDERGPRFARHDEELRRRCNMLNVALHRCILQLALLERDGRMQAAEQHCIALADLLNRHRIWPLLINEAALRGVSPECKVLLMRHCKGGDNILYSMAENFAGGRAENIYGWANLLTTRRDEDNKPTPEPELLASILRDYLMNNDMMPATPAQLEEMQKRWLKMDEQFPGRGIAEALLIPGRMNDVLYTPNIDPARICAEASRRGYFLISHALKKGDLPTAEKLLAGMTANPKHYRHPGTRLAAALVARAKGDEAAAREHERLGISQAAMHQYSYYSFHWTDAHRILLEHGLTQASEKLMLLIPERDLSYTRPILARKWAEQRQFRSAAFTLEMLMARFCSNAAPVAGLGTQEDLLTWRLQADVYHALALLQQKNDNAANNLLETAMTGLERMPSAAALVAPAILRCADIPAETRNSYRQRLLNGCAGCPAALEALHQVQPDNLPTADESAELNALRKIHAPESFKPLDSPFYTWHLQKQEIENDEEREHDERTATRVTIDARIISTAYGQQGKSPWIELETQTGRRLKVNFDNLEADDLSHIIDWKERNNIRTWIYRETKYTDPAPFDARLDRMLQGKSGGKSLRNDIDISDGRQAEFTRTDGSYFKEHVNMLNDEAVSYIEQFSHKAKLEPRLHRSFSEAEAEARRRHVALRIFMLGKPGGPEEAAFREQLKSEGVSLQQYNSLLVCYKNDNGEWDAAGCEALKMLNSCPEAFHTPGENHLDGGFFINFLSGDQPSVSYYRYGKNAWDDKEYRALAEAIRSGNRAEAERLLDTRPELLKAHSYYTGKSSALSIAILNRKTDMVGLLLQRGANPNDRTAEGHTMLYQAVCCNTPDIVRLLLKHGARHDIPSIQMGGKKALPYFACANKPEVLKVLLEAGVDPNLRNEKGENLLHTLLPGYLEVDTDAIQALARVLVPAGLDINATDAMGNSVLYKVASCAKGNASWNPSRVPPLLQTMKELIDMGADPEETAAGLTPMIDRLKGMYNLYIVPELCPEVEQILREYRRKPQN